jgi:DNA-binding NarL/FixJ family response regulator
VRAPRLSSKYRASFFFRVARRVSSSLDRHLFADESRTPRVSQVEDGGSVRGDVDHQSLTPRELAVATRVVDGLALKIIAAELDISVQAASTYLTRARRKLGQPSRWGMAALLRGPLPSFAKLAADRYAELTPAELELGDLLLQGASNADIARAAGISNKLAGRRVSRLLRTLCVASRAELFDLAARFLSLERGRELPPAPPETVGGRGLLSQKGDRE